MRPGGRWFPDGRAKHLHDACAASAHALDVSAIDLYQLHAVDSRVPIETSVRALAELQRSGLIRRIGLSNVTVSQIKTAQKLADIASVQVSLSVLDDENLRNGVVEYCLDQGIQLIAYRPIGGKRPAGSRATQCCPKSPSATTRHRMRSRSRGCSTLHPISFRFQEQRAK